MKIDKKFLDELTRKVLKQPSDKFSKGSMGNICVIGGSEYYTGAPYFSAISALRFGCDLSYVICPQNAAIPIKSYSPDIIVLPILNENLEIMSSLFQKMDAFVLGPGLGRDQDEDRIKEIFELITFSKKPFVIDADGIYYATKFTSLIKGSSIFLTPNLNEIKRMANKLNLSSDSNPRELSLALGGCWIFMKGFEDVITGFDGIEHRNGISGSPRRCGGQGDILSGVLATSLFWVVQREEQILIGHPNYLAAALVSSHFVKSVSEIVYKNKGMGMIASDMINYISEYVYQIFKTC